MGKALKPSNYQRIIRLAGRFCWGMILFLALSLVSPVLAQLPRPDDVAAKVYQRIPDFPLENQYVSQETGEIASDNTLLSRLIRYHQYIKNRPLIYRLDWQLTFADYLQVNETMFENRYPGNQTLTTNPLNNDRKAIANLSRSQRNQLIDTLLAIYNPTPEPVPQAPSVTPQPPTRENRDNSPRLPQPGDAELLLP
ncbi:MAG: hypothetical protein QNJ65_12845 [Xenococcaceae cyanobacterium MO_234.B1]|nr:hypothetical protein [Xenococcaceae cyanobacterium MO_234.B1]